MWTGVDFLTHRAVDLKSKAFANEHVEADTENCPTKFKHIFISSIITQFDSSLNLYDSYYYTKDSSQLVNSLHVFYPLIKKYQLLTKV